MVVVVAAEEEEETSVVLIEVAGVVDEVAAEAVDRLLDHRPDHSVITIMAAAAASMMDRSITVVADPWEASITGPRPTMLVTDWAAPTGSTEVAEVRHLFFKQRRTRLLQSHRI